MTKGGVVCNEDAHEVLERGRHRCVGSVRGGQVTWQAGGYSESVCFGKVAGAQAYGRVKPEYGERLPETAVSLFHIAISHHDKETAERHGFCVIGSAGKNSVYSRTV